MIYVLRDDLVRQTRFQTFCSELGISSSEALLYLGLLCCWFANRKQAWHLKYQESDLLAQAAGWDGDPNVFANALFRNGFIKLEQGNKIISFYGFGNYLNKYDTIGDFNFQMACEYQRRKRAQERILQAQAEGQQAAQTQPELSQLELFQAQQAQPEQVKEPEPEGRVQKKQTKQSKKSKQGQRRQKQQKPSEGQQYSLFV